MSPITLERGDFWEFKGRCAELDLAIVRARMALAELTGQKNAILDAFATRHGLDPARPLKLDDVALTVTQD